MIGIDHKDISIMGFNSHLIFPLSDSIDPSKITLYEVSRVLSGFPFQD